MRLEREDPVARRNRGDNRGLWFLGALAVVVVALLVANLFKPQAAMTASLPEPAPVSMAQRVHDDEARLARLELARRSADVPAERTVLPPRG